MVSVKANCIDSTAAPEAVFAREVQKLKEERIKPFEQLTLEPFERGGYGFSGFGTRLTRRYRSLHCDWQICALFELENTRTFEWEGSIRMLLRRRGLVIAKSVQRCKVNNIKASLPTILFGCYILAASIAIVEK